MKARCGSSQARGERFVGWGLALGIGVACLAGGEGSKDKCYQYEYENWTQSEPIPRPGDKCSLYSDCPTKVSCVFGSEFQAEDTVSQIRLWPCETYRNGFLDPQTGWCTGGEEVFPPEEIVIPVQDCKGWCTN